MSKIIYLTYLVVIQYYLPIDSWISEPIPSLLGFSLCYIRCHV